MATRTPDVAIIGGGPAGSTCASLLCKYNPRLDVLVLERESFPRDHVGESQLPTINNILIELGVWEKVEAANFPIKVGATYRWGRTDDLWDFEFLIRKFVGGPRPAAFAGERTLTAFQVDRAIYDKILLDHSRSLGCNVLQPMAVRKVLTEGDRVDGLVLENGDEVKAKYYVDATGHTGIIRRAMGVEVDCPTSLQNIAIWDYWQNTDWAVKIGVGGTRIQVLSLGYGWLWFIPLGPTRTSLGLVIPASYYKASGKRPEELYKEAIYSDPVVKRLIENAESEGKLSTTKDWSFVSQRLAGENWWLAGESAGFADPILSAGMTLAHMGARDVAYSILALERGDYEAEWLQQWYDTGNRAKIAQHIRFADFWYTANGCFSDLKDETQRIAKDAGLDMTPDQAWQWLGTGGFVDADLASANHGEYSVPAMKDLSGNLIGTEPIYASKHMNLFRLNLEGTTKGWSARMTGGRIYRHRSYFRDGRALPNIGIFASIIKLAKEQATAADLWGIVDEAVRERRLGPNEAGQLARQLFDAVEAMVCDGWLIASCDPALPRFGAPDYDDRIVHPNVDILEKAD